jgi:hypothetical protein
MDKFSFILLSFFFLFLLLFSSFFSLFQPSIFRGLLFVFYLLIFTPWFLNKLVCVAQICDKRFLVYQIIFSCYEPHSTLPQKLHFSTHLSSCGENALRTTLQQTFRASINNVSYCSHVKPTYVPLTYITIKLFVYCKVFRWNCAVFSESVPHWLNFTKI